MSIHLAIYKSINKSLYSLQDGGDHLFRMAVNSANISRYFQASSPDEPSLKMAMKGPERNEWLRAMFKEIEERLNRGTFYFVPRLPAEHRGHLVTSKWVLKKKYKSSGEP